MHCMEPLCHFAWDTGTPSTSHSHCVICSLYSPHPPVQVRARMCVLNLQSPGGFVKRSICLQPEASGEQDWNGTNDSESLRTSVLRFLPPVVLQVASPPPLITTQGTSGGGVKAWLTIHKPFNIPLRPIPSGDVSHPKGAHIHPSWSHKALPLPSIQTTARLK